ncbi:MAG: guanylate kinase [Planctomycetota bacterium]|jgi:guanylate kinase
MKSFAVAICAPSGVGKTTVAKRLIEGGEGVLFSVSVTTRGARPGEQPDVAYHFVSRDEFEAMVTNGELLEWAEVHGDLYGTPLANLEAAEREGQLLLLDIDVQGARQVMQSRPDTVTIFLLPPSFEALMERLRERASEDDARLRRRMATAKAELRSVEGFDYVVVNDRLEDAVRDIRAIIHAESRRLDRQAAEVEDLRRRLLEALEAEGR